MKKLSLEIKIALIFLVVIVVGVIIYFCYSSVSKLNDVRSSNDIIDKANKEIDASQLSLTTVQLNTICEKLYKAMNGLGTDIDAVYDSFSIANSRSDVLAIIATFGVRDGETLQEWLSGDLAQDEILHLNSLLAAKNINYQF